MLRLLLKLLLLPFYRLDLAHGDRLPGGAALLVCQHVSPLDAVILRILLPRKVLCVTAGTFSGHPLHRLAGAAAVDYDDAASFKRAMERAAKALAKGKLVCLCVDARLRFPGSLRPLERALDVLSDDAPLLPVMIEGPWGSRFRGRDLPPRFPRAGRWPVTVVVGEVVGVTAATSDVDVPPAPDVEQASPDGASGRGDARVGSGDGAGRMPTSRGTLVALAFEKLEAEVWRIRKSHLRPLAFSIVRGYRVGRFRMAMADPIRGAISRLKALTGAVAIARALRKHWGDQRRVGILMPPSIGGALANLAAILSGRVIVNLNYTTGAEGMASAVRQAGLESVVTSRQFLKKGDIEPPQNVEIIHLEDVAKTIGGGARIFALLAAMFAPYAMVRRLCGAVHDPAIDDPHAVIFTSGSTAEPKGVVISHFSIISNIEGACRQVDLDSRDRLVHMLPFFHTFGNFLLFAGVHLGPALVLLPNPLEAESVGEMTEDYAATILVATPTFLQMYTRRCEPGQFGSLRLVVAGAEKLHSRVADAFHQRFGIEVSEGYGCTELSPVVGVNAEDHRAPGVLQYRRRRGSIGQPFPGIEVRVVDAENGKKLPIGEPGMLLVKGPNVMTGYLDRPEDTAEVLNDGWYRTGDIVRLDEAGFITITDRLSRFSKIGGEMVPHGRVEEALHQVVESDEQVFAVTSVPDAKKGERLVVVYCRRHVRVEHVVSGLKDTGLPNIFVPRPRDFIEVDELPVLGTGKLDLKALKEIAREELSDDE